MQGKRHYLKEWREYRGMSQKGVAAELEMLAQESRFQNDRHAQNQGKTYTTLGRVENGEVPYSQALLEMLAVIYDTDTGSLITRDPREGESVLDVWKDIPEDDRATAIRVLRSLVKRTGTDG